MDYIERVRSETFGLKVKRRVVLGNFLLSSKFEKYNDKKPVPAIKLRIHNLFMEYENSLDKDHAAAEFLEIC